MISYQCFWFVLLNFPSPLVPRLVSHEHLSASSYSGTDMKVMGWTGLVMSKLFILPNMASYLSYDIISYQIMKNHFFPSAVMRTGASNTCPSHHQSPPPSIILVRSYPNHRLGIYEMFISNLIWTVSNLI